MTKTDLVIESFMGVLAKVQGNLAGVRGSSFLDSFVVHFTVYDASAISFFRRCACQNESSFYYTMNCISIHFHPDLYGSLLPGTKISCYYLVAALYNPPFIICACYLQFIHKYNQLNHHENRRSRYKLQGQ